MRPRLAAIVIVLAILALTAFVDTVARSEHRAGVESDVAAQADSLVRALSDAVVSESASAETLSAFVEIDAVDTERLEADFPVFAAALMKGAPNIRSVQLGPDSILEYVFPVAGNEQAVGLDLMADPDRRALLESAILSGETVVQGPVELVQGGLGLIVRHPVYPRDSEFWGFAAIVLDWPGIAAESGLDSLPKSVTAGLSRAGESDAIAGDPMAFDGDPVTRTLQVGATATTWTLAVRPTDGWPVRAPTTTTLWISGSVIALLAAIGVAELLGRPEALMAERKKALDDLALAEARYTATFQSAGVGILVADSRGRIVSGNRAFKDTVGLEVDADVAGQLLADFVHAEDTSELSNGSRSVIGTGGVAELELRLMQGESPRWCRAQLTRIQHEETRLLVAVIEDVTARRVAEEALAQSEANYRHLFAAAPIAILRQDFSLLKQRLDEYRAEGHDDLDALVGDEDIMSELAGLVRITDANPVARALNSQLGSDSENVDPRGLAASEARKGFVASLKAIRDGDEAVSIPISRVTGDGRQLHLDLRWQPVPTSEGLDYSQVMVTISDVTRLTETKRSLQDLLLSKDRFLATVAHELRTPLTSIVGFAHELKDNPALSEQDRSEFVGLVAQNSVEMSHLIEDILVVAREEVGEVQITPELVDLAVEVTTALRLLPDHGVVPEVPSAGQMVVADPARVRQILRNLVTNAVRYGGDNVTITIGAVGECAFVDVGDDGPPLSPADAGRIFEPYQKLSGSPSVPGSIGLGLTVSRALARAQGGEISLRRADDRNVFRLSLPNPDASPR